MVVFFLRECELTFYSRINRLEELLGFVAQTDSFTIESLAKQGLQGARLHCHTTTSQFLVSLSISAAQAALAPGQSLYRGFGQRLEEMNDLYRDRCQVWWYYTSSSSVHRDVAYRSFARGCGTLMEITGVHNAKDIQALSMIPSEGELLILPNTDFEVKVALSCGQARLLNARYTTIPDNVDLVILEAAPPSTTGCTTEHVS
jgi:hypothetical protein